MREDKEGHKEFYVKGHRTSLCVLPIGWHISIECHSCCDTDNSALRKGLSWLRAFLSFPANLLQKMEAVQDDGS